MSPIAASAQSFLPRILGTDGAHMKHREYNGIMLILVGRDGNNSNVIMAVALCPTENAENYTWFLQQCVNGGISFENLPLFCDRGGGIFGAAGQLGIRSLVHCTRHLIGNMKNRFKATFSIDLQNLV